jgi:hypothetical protein
LAWLLWSLAVFGISGIAWLDHLLRQAGRPDLAQLAGSTIVLPTLGMVIAATVGAVLAGRRPDHPVGWLMLAVGVLLTASGVCGAYANLGLLARPGTVPAARSVALFLPVMIPAMLTCISLVLLLTPTGSLPSSRWRWWAVSTAALPVVCMLAIALDPGASAQAYPPPDLLDLRNFGGTALFAYRAAFAVSVLALVVAQASLVVRYRRSGATERQQLRWVALASALIVPAAAVVPIAVVMDALSLAAWASGAVVAALPLAIGAAVLRYRLYDLDRIVSRTVAYSVLTVLLGGGYAAAILILGQFVGQRSNLVVAGATLAVAAVFQPARRRVQRMVDRRFNRRSYDGARTIEAFAARLRQQVDLDALAADLRAVVDRTMQPTWGALWLRSTTGAATASPARPGRTMLEATPPPASAASSGQPPSPVRRSDGPGRSAGGAGR